MPSRHRSQSLGSASYATAKTHFTSGRYGLAIKSFHAAVESDPNSIESLNGLAASYDQVGRFDLAERYYRQALTLDPESSQSLNNLGYSFLLQGKYDLAAVYLREAKVLGEENEVIAANQQTAEAALQSVGRRDADALPAVPVEPVETAQLVREPRLRIERTSEGVSKACISPSPWTSSPAEAWLVRCRRVRALLPPARPGRRRLAACRAAVRRPPHGRR